MKSTPFSLSGGIDWVLPQRKSRLPLKANYVNIRCALKETPPQDSPELYNITQIFNDKKLPEKGPVRILAQGRKKLCLNKSASSRMNTDCSSAHLAGGGCLLACGDVCRDTSPDRHPLRQTPLYHTPIYTTPHL